jgi:hypothetical protein
VQVSAENLPDSKPRYLMGVGHQVRVQPQCFGIVSAQDGFLKAHKNFHIRKAFSDSERWWFSKYFAAF